MAYFVMEQGRLQACDGMMDHRGLSYGDGFFSTMGVYDGQIVCVAGHHHRLMVSAQRLELVVDVDGVMGALHQLAKQMNQGVIKIIITRATQSVRGYGYDDGKACVLIKTMPSMIYQGVRFYEGIPCQSFGVAVRLSERLSPRTPRFAGLKLISSHEQVFVHRELLCHQQANPAITEGLVATVAGEQVSGAMGNVFYCLGGVWYTPFVNNCGVDGVMRQALLAKFAIKERMLHEDELSRIDGLMFCNAVRGVMPMTALMMGEQVRHFGVSFLDVLMS